MILVSSARPFDICTPSIIKNQIAANRSWLPIFDKIFYFNRREQKLSDNKVAFLIYDTKPTIKAMAKFASQLDGWSCIINADIQVGLRFNQVESALKKKDALCAVSRRYEIADEQKKKVDKFSKAAIRDGSLDFFAAIPDVWKHVADKINDQLTIGKSVWDTWLLNFFVGEFKLDCYDISPSKCVFHVKHQSNREKFFNYPKDDPFLQKSRWPLQSIQI